MPRYSAAALMGITPSGVRPCVIIMIAMTRPRTSARTASCTMLMLSEPMMEPKRPANTPRNIAQNVVVDRAKAADANAQR